jgi:hypothetical protein
MQTEDGGNSWRELEFERYFPLTFFLDAGVLVRSPQPYFIIFIISIISIIIIIIIVIIRPSAFTAAILSSISIGRYCDCSAPLRLTIATAM